MRDSKGIRICNNEVIIHILNPHNNQLVLSNRAISLTGESSDYLRAFFCGHIENGLKDPVSRTAKFSDIYGSPVPRVCSGLLNSETSLVEGSKLLAQCLYDVMKSNANIASGDLIVCLYETENYPSNRYLAILKVDPSKILLRTTRYDDQGQPYIELDLQTDALPTTGEKLQKCAFIRPFATNRLEYDMLLLDRQVSSQQKDAVARFFIKDFLTAEHVYDDYMQTKKLHTAFLSAHAQVRAEISDQDSEMIDSRIYSALTGQSINLDTWLEELPVQPEVREKFNSVLLQVLQDRQFTLSRQASEEVTRRRVYQGDFGLHLSIRADKHDELIQVKRVTNDPARPAPYFEVTIRTEKWKEVR